MHEIKILVLSYHPVIAIETPEEDRVEALLRSVATDIKVPLMVWSLTEGLKRWGEQNAIYETTDPARALATIGEIGVDAIYWLKDMAPHLHDPALSRKLRDLAERFANNRTPSTIFLTGAELDLSSDISATAVHYELKHARPGRVPGRDPFGAAIAGRARWPRDGRPSDGPTWFNSPKR